MIACDNPDYPIEWFHTSCLQMTILFKGKAKWVTAEDYQVFQERKLRNI